MAEAASGVRSVSEASRAGGPCSLRMLLVFAMRERERDGSVMTAGGGEVGEDPRLAEWAALA